MIKHKNVFGVDISKDFFDVVSADGVHDQFLNNDAGFAAFIATLPKRSLVVMESTGYYHHRLAEFLVARKIKTSVMNPLPIKRFRQMKFSKIKTDKVDAQMICEYAKQNEVPLYKAKNKINLQCRQLFALADLYQKQLSALKAKLKGETDMGAPSPWVIRSMKRHMHALSTEIFAIDKELTTLIGKRYPGQMQLLEGIPGIGPKTSSYLILITEGFTKFETAKQLCSFTGVTPTVRESGSSIRGKSRITKMGNPKIRSLLFLCSFSASKYNTACRALFERIVDKGKSKKLALIAICNKLLRQAFAVATTGKAYDPNHTPPAAKLISQPLKALCL